MNLRSLGAWATAGVALWVSLGSLDVASTPAGAARIAMLPSLLLLPAAVALALAAGWVTRPRTPLQRSTDAVLPLYALWVLVLPYLPWLPDWLPILRVFAGPACYLVWLVVIVQVVWSALGSGSGRVLATRAREWSDTRAFLLAWAIAGAVYGIAAAAVAPSGMFPGGDEPHYLVITQSLLADGDLNIENNHQRSDYRAYFSDDLEPHVLARGVRGEMYSVHPVGLPLLAAPAFALGGYPAVVVFMLLMAAAASALAWIWVRRLTGSVSAATFASVAPGLSVPFVFSAGTVYPEVAGALAVMVAFAIGLRGPEPGADAGARLASAARGLVVGVAAAALPWLSSKYAVLSAVIVAIAARRVLADRAAASERLPRLLAVGVPYVVGLAGWFWFFYASWGSPWPSAAYGGASQTQMAFGNLVRGIPGLLFDQEYGALPYAPVLAAASAGLWHQWRGGGRQRWLAAEVALAFTALLVTVAGHTMWWGGTSVPARFLVAGLLLLALPIAWEYRRVAQTPDRRAAYRLLLLVGISLTVAVMASPGGLALANRRNGISRLLEWLSPDWRLWAYVPDFIGQTVGVGLVQVAIWIAGVGGAGWLLSHLLGRSPEGSISRIGRGLTFLRADAALTLGVLVVTLVTPVVLRGQLKPDVSLEDRARVAMLDRYDPVARPFAIRYAPLTIIDAAAVPSEFVLSARPGSRRGAQPVPLLFNARYALPSGEYRVELVPKSGTGSAPLAGALRVQAGRFGGSLASWTVAAAPGAGWSGTFLVPVDMNFVGFVASTDLAATAGELRLVPTRVVSGLERVASHEVLSSMMLGGQLAVLFHDGASYPEDRGFWVRAGAPAAVSVIRPGGRLTGPVTLGLRNGPYANTVRITTPDGTTELSLEPNDRRTVAVAPAAIDGTLRFVIEARRGFVPADVEPGSRDRRVLGCWVELAE